LTPWPGRRQRVRATHSARGGAACQWRAGWEQVRRERHLGGNRRVRRPAPENHEHHLGQAPVVPPHQIPVPATPRAGRKLRPRQVRRRPARPSPPPAARPAVPCASPRPARAAAARTPPRKRRHTRPTLSHTRSSRANPLGDGPGQTSRVAPRVSPHWLGAGIPVGIPRDHHCPRERPGGLPRTSAAARSGDDRPTVRIARPASDQRSATGTSAPVGWPTAGTPFATRRGAAGGRGGAGP
jgi:hypothetical protein